MAFKGREEGWLEAVRETVSSRWFKLNKESKTEQVRCVMKLLKQKDRNPSLWGWRDNIGDQVLALHFADPVLNSQHSHMIPEHETGVTRDHKVRNGI